MIRNGLVAFSLALAAVFAGTLMLDWRAEHRERERQRERLDARCGAELKRLPKWQGIVALDSDIDAGRERRTITITPPDGVPLVWGGVRGPTAPFRFRDLPVPGLRIDAPTRFESDWVPGPVRESMAISLQIGPKLWSGDEADRLARVGLEARFPLADASEVVAVEGPDAAPRRIAIAAAMGADVLSPADGVVVEVEDRFRDLGCPPALSNGLATFPITNHLVLHADEGVRVELRHLQQGSVAVVPGQRVTRGERLARVGRSGDAPFEQLRMTATVMTLGPTRAVPFRFERRGGGRWTAELGAVPHDVTPPR